ncbi:MAG: hypothetical protein ACR2JG_12425 [Geodermatophilaceae bacterium]
MPTVDLVDESYLRAPVERVASVVHDEGRWVRWWPELRPVVFMDRGAAGIRWNITGALVGSMEIWLEAYVPPMDGVLLHFYLRADPTAAGSTTEPAPLSGRAATAESVRWARANKVNLWNLKDEMEAGLRRVGKAGQP